MAVQLPEHCTLCPRCCGADRRTEAGRCGAGNTLRAARAALHRWEEPCISGEDFPRVKIGVGKKPNPQYDLAAWVLGNFPKEQQEDLGKALKNAIEAAKLITKGKTEKAMNLYNS